MSKWLSKAAVLWVLDEAPDVPPTLVSTLLAVARYAGEDGRGAHPSATTVAAHTRKSESQAKRDLAALEDAGLTRRGDQRIVAYIRTDRRPTVYDLPLPRGSTHDTPSSGNGVAPMRGRGSTHAVNGVAPVLPEEVLKTSRTARGVARAGGASDPRAEIEPGWPFGKSHCTDPRCFYLWPDGPNRPCPNHTLRAPPCPDCGKPFSQEMLANPDNRAMAFSGEAVCVECYEKDREAAP